MLHVVRPPKSDSWPRHQTEPNTPSIPDGWPAGLDHAKTDPFFSRYLCQSMLGSSRLIYHVIHNRRSTTTVAPVQPAYKVSATGCVVVATKLRSSHIPHNIRSSSLGSSVMLLLVACALGGMRASCQVGIRPRTSCRYLPGSSCVQQLMPASLTNMPVALPNLQVSLTG